MTAIDGTAAGQEEYVLAIPDDGAMSHRIRYQMPDGAETVKVMLGDGNSYEETECGTYGKYITFSAPGNEVVVRIIEDRKDNGSRLWIPIGAGACALAAAAVVTTIVIRKKKSQNKSRNRKQKKPEK